MKVFCKYCRFYDPAGWIGGDMELDGGVRTLLPAECDYGETRVIVAVSPPTYHPEEGLRTNSLMKKEVTLAHNRNFECIYYWKKWWIRQKGINKRERL